MRKASGPCLKLLHSPQADVIPCSGHHLIFHLGTEGLYGFLLGIHVLSSKEVLFIDLVLFYRRKQLGVKLMLDRFHDSLMLYVCKGAPVPALIIIKQAGRLVQQSSILHC